MYRVLLALFLVLSALSCGPAYRAPLAREAHATVRFVRSYPDFNLDAALVLEELRVNGERAYREVSAARELVGTSRHEDLWVHPGPLALMAKVEFYNQIPTPRGMLNIRAERCENAVGLSARAGVGYVLQLTHRGRDWCTFDCFEEVVDGAGQPHYVACSQASPR